MQVADCMRTTVYTIAAGATLREAMQLMAQHMIGTLPVVDDKKQVVGLISYVRVGSLFLSDWFKHFSNKE